MAFQLPSVGLVGLRELPLRLRSQAALRHCQSWTEAAAAGARSICPLGLYYTGEKMRGLTAVIVTRMERQDLFRQIYLMLNKGEGRRDLLFLYSIGFPKSSCEDFCRPRSSLRRWVCSFLGWSVGYHSFDHRCSRFFQRRFS